MTSCRTCGNPLNFANGSKCIKCGEPLRPYRSLLEVDVAHAGESWEQAEEKIKRAVGESWEEASQKIVKAVDRGLSGRHKGVKIIHGHGRSTGRSLIYRKAVDLLRELADQTGGRLVQDNGNPGAHILWLNR